MPATRLKKFLDSQDVRYEVIQHSPAYTAQEIAARAHVRGKEMVKSVILRVDGRLALAALPASQLVDPARLRREIGASTVEIATEQDFRDAFPECEVGAMPPFGNLWGLNVYADRRLATHQEITFNAGSHIELIRMAYADFERLVRPVVLELSAVPVYTR